MDISRGTDRQIGATFFGSREAHEYEPFTKTSKTLAVMQGKTLKQAGAVLGDRR